MVLCFVVHCWLYGIKGKIYYGCVCDYCGVFVVKWLKCTVFVVTYRNSYCFTYTKMNYLGE
ncbi:hypothetical protein WICANDRAFT_87190 [Wickerhamomyces anomalus NRRL Y-366-8]|uniref:Uncharacterized protein n=1 Tax=Wickerhamomyces anomalus (strain ATCC 58044 / CBS 1984 / NCYC 433 / NRRL Y-366-8) TaxID=683960 RepID=A0A1E3P9K5_WICAA|nr:uncharacterized protein WICANDRAFT_87190 [Wickerhamomyces anomalus NRRL Y-366-8]ODQ62048.1 hypothetical protein WICANDRAFT_87190 [Wickerhamomyces anomalus NRRL Y-366-8]